MNDDEDEDDFKKLVAEFGGCFLSLSLSDSLSTATLESCLLG